MATVHFTANLRRLVDCPTDTATGGTVATVLDTYFAAHPEVRRYILDDTGRLRRHIAVFVNNDHVTDREELADPVAPDDEVHVLQALSGG